MFSTPNTWLGSVASQAATPALGPFLIHLALAALLAMVLAWVYARWGHALSNRAAFGRNFVLIATTTMLIISIVKSSLALSLGLVGALSIIRFRAAIKEPEELGYLFLAISLGLGMGAGQAVLTTVAFLAILTLMVAQNLRASRDSLPGLQLSVTSGPQTQLTLSRIQQELADSGMAARLRHMHEGRGMFEASFALGPTQARQLESCSEKLRALGPDVQVGFLEQDPTGL